GVLADEARVAARPARDRPDHLFARSERLAAEPAEDAVTPVVGPDRAAQAQALAVVEADRLPAEARGKALAGREDDRARHLDDRGRVPVLDGHRLPPAGRRPRPRERDPTVGRLPGRGRRREAGEKDRESDAEPRLHRRLPPPRDRPPLERYELPLLRLLLLPLLRW